MKRLFLILVSLYTLSFGFSLESITNSVSDSVGAIGKSIGNSIGSTESTINVDNECKKQFESYDFNWAGIMKTATVYGISNSTNALNFLNENSKNDIKEDDIKSFAKTIAKNYLWIPLDAEKVIGKLIYDDRVEQNKKIIPVNTKLSQYKVMYKKVNNFVNDYKKYLEEKGEKFPYELKVRISSEPKIAESLPYGYIIISKEYIENGLYKVLIPHELTHISKRHVTKEIQFRLVNMYDSTTEILSLIKSMQDKSSMDKLLIGLAGTKVIKNSFETYSHEQELEADACALKTIYSMEPKKKNYNRKKC